METVEFSSEGYIDVEDKFINGITQDKTPVGILPTKHEKKSYKPSRVYKNQTFRTSDFPYPIERTASGTLYGRLPNGQMVKLDEEKK